MLKPFIASALLISSGWAIAAEPPLTAARYAQQLGVGMDVDWARTERGPGWIEYDILNLETGKVQSKASYVHRLDDRLVLGCGVYRTAPTAGAQAVSAPDSSARPAPRLHAAAAATG